MARDVLIVGGGLSGTLTAIHLLWRCDRDDRIIVADPNPILGRGIAYGTNDRHHLLNVPAMGMSAFSDAPDDFARWLATQFGTSPAEVRTTFAPRILYAQYIGQRLLEAVVGSSGELQVVHGQVTSIRAIRGRYEADFENGSRCSADAVILALGNQKPSGAEELKHLEGHKGYVANPWRPAAMQDISPTDSVVLVGTGLTMVDWVVTLKARHHTGRIIAFSRRGLLPHRHSLGGPVDAFDPSTVELTARGVAKAISGLARGRGDGWRSTIDGLRPHTTALWAAMPWDERRRALRRLTAYWDIHRHRIAPEIHDLLTEVRGSGQLEVLSGRVERAIEQGAKISIGLKTKGGVRRLTADRVVNCTGPDLNLRAAKIPVLESLVSQGAVQYDPLGLGVLVDQAGVAGSDIYAVGPICRGCRWETTAAPEIRVQAQGIAARIMEAPVPTLV